MVSLLKKMNKILFFLLLSSALYAQDKVPSYTHIISVVTENRDTLYLINTEVGQIIKEVWNEFDRFKEEKPTIIMKPKEWLICENEKRCLKMKN